MDVPVSSEITCASAPSAPASPTMAGDWMRHCVPVAAMGRRVVVA